MECEDFASSLAEKSNGCRGLECEARSVKCEVWSVKEAVGSEKCEV